MLNITIIAISKLKADYLSLSQDVYLKRLFPYVALKIEEIKAESFSDNNQEKSKKIEAEKIESKLSKILAKEEGVKVFLLREGGRLMNSPDFSKYLNSLNGKIVFVLAGALGFSKDLEKKYSAISLSPLTFTHEMARIILLEQVFRAVCIDKGKNYHY